MTPLTTLEYADGYFDEIVSIIDWSDFTDEEKVKGLKSATQLINLLGFSGAKTDPLQENAFPRNNEQTVPVDIQQACAEIAAALLNGVDLDLETESLYMKSMGYSNVRSTYDTDKTPEHIIAGIPSIKAWRLILPYLSDNKTIGVSRV